MKYLLALLIITNFAYGQSGNIKWIDPTKMTNQSIDGRGWNDGFTFPYDRLPQKAQSMVRPVLWDLSKHAAGEYINFTSNSSTIYVRLKVKGAQAMAQMPATGVSGVDLYAKGPAGNWNWTKATVNFKDTITYKFENIKDAELNNFFRLYLPLCNAVSWLEIGVPETNNCTLLPAQNDKPIVAYGTSIMHGAYASRPGLGWTNILGRKLDSKIINLGFSGNGQLEPAMIDLINEIDAKLYILDCMPNLWDKTKFSAEEIEKRMRHAQLEIHKKHPGVPIIFTEHCSGKDGINADTIMAQKYIAVSKISAAVFKKMKKEGIKNIYALTASQIGFDTESTLDGTHPNDIGMMQYANAYYHLITRKIGLLK
jgi:hypothetical protein